MIEIVIFVLGAIVGSFLNVCIHRIPEESSIVFPASHCPKCGKAIRWYDNIPLISYLVLRGRCRDCRERISIRYVVVEGLTAFAALFLYGQFGLGLPFLSAFVFVAALIIITFIDLAHQIIPHAITLPGIPVFLLAAIFIMGIRPVDAFVGMMTGIGCLYLIAVYYEALTGNEGMGGGDVNLLAMMGAFLGWQSLIFILLIAAFSGAAVGIAIMIARGKNLKYAVPFGPFLSLGAVVYLFFGERLRFFLFP
ncbi:MAG: Type 4 prepilin-like proteins leader peptide-processing enzyme [Syntrophus sp. SKADARSKE-3]|nr:Type 4 prepilin-like proteins leader peptide-processing enzyme [Syntrophus sp. SKADARSKE-3]